MKTLLQYCVPAVLFLAVLGLSAAKTDASCSGPEYFYTSVENLSTTATDFEFDLHLTEWELTHIPYAGYMVDASSTGHAGVDPDSVSANPDWTNFSAQSCSASGQDIYLFSITGEYQGTCPTGGANLNLDVRLYRDVGSVLNVQACNVGCPP